MPLAWGFYFFPHHFKKVSPQFHNIILTEALRNKRLAIAAPRESAKSTILSFLLPSHAITFKRKKFIIIVQNTFDKATGTLYTLKKEFKSNQALMNSFRVEITRDTEGDSIFKHPDGFETRVLCKGADQIGSVRGEKFGEQRPDLIIVDDLEDDEMVKNPERRAYLKQLFDEVLGKAGAEGEVDIWVVGTILHDDCLLANLLNEQMYTEYKKLFFKALARNNGELVSLWSEKWSVETLLKLKKDKPVVFAKEMQNNPVTGSLARFKKEQFRYWQEGNGTYELYLGDEVFNRGRFSECKAAIACDLAWSERREADETIIMPCFLTPESFILVGDYIQKKGMRPDEFAEQIFALETRLKNLTGTYVPIGLEKAMLEKVYNWVLKQEMKKRNHWLMTKELKWENDKITRIETVLQPRYANGAMFHKRNQGDLEYQLLRFPSGTHDDIIDALQGVCRLLEHPKSAKDVEGKSDHFAWLQKQSQEYHHPKRGKFSFGKKLLSRPSIKAQESWI